ncbi:ankyrin-2-like [Ceratina calcarata]|uniref:Ankyrin-2-like n=1 Tax=Ceratina calcarata TaxID=156304 RepID=A0AAJ7SAZ0_9HYME|nr:ankyrin-2-like [Ceratina calcarata]
MLGLRSKDTLNTKCKIALILDKLERHKEAYSIYQEIYLKLEEMSVSNHRTILPDQFHMVLARLGRYEEALNMCRLKYEKCKSTFGIDNLQSLHAQSNVAFILAQQGKLKDALKILEEAFNTMKSLFGTNHPDTLKILSAIADVILKQNRYQKAMKHYQELINIQEIVLGRNYPETLDTYHKIIWVLFKQRKWISALRICRKIVPRMKNTFTPTHDILLTTLKIMEDCNSALKFQRLDISDFFHHIQEINTAANDGDIQKIQRLLEDDIDLNDTDTEGRTPLHYAASKGQINVVNLLLSSGADVDVSSGDGQTPLHVATSNGHWKIVDILLQHVNRDNLDMFINAETIRTSTTSLHIAAENGFLDIVCCLLSYGAIYNIENKKGETPADLSKHQSIVDLLRMIEELFTYAENGNNEIIRVIRELSSDKFVAVTKARNNEGHTLLQVTMLNQHKRLANELVNILQQNRHHLKVSCMISK